MCQCVMDDRGVSVWAVVCSKWLSWWLAILCENSRVNDGDNGEGKYCIGVNTSELAKRLWHCLKYGRPLSDVHPSQAEHDTIKSTCTTRQSETENIFHVTHEKA